MASTAATRPAVVDGLTTLRPALLWPALIARLNGDAELRTILGGAGRVMAARADAFVGDEDVAWLRCVVVPVVRAYTLGLEPPPNAPRVLPFLVRVDANDPRSPDYDPMLRMEAAHARMYRLLSGYAPAVAGCRVVTPIWRESPPDPEPLGDVDSGTLYLSAEYRCDAVPAPLTD